MKASIKTYSTLILLCLFGFTATAFAQGAVASDDTSWLDAARPIFDAIVHGNYWLAAALAVMAAVPLTRKHLLPASWSIGLKGDLVGMATAFVLAFAGAIANWAATQLGDGAPMTGAVAFAALKIGATAILGFTALHKLATALAATAWFKTKVPTWLQALVAIALKVVGSSAIAKAEAAGDKAVAQKPSTGAAPGTFTEF